MNGERFTLGIVRIGMSMYAQVIDNAHGIIMRVEVKASDKDKVRKAWNEMLSKLF